jgi:hypothetical protein
MHVLRNGQQRPEVNKRIKMQKQSADRLLSTTLDMLLLGAATIIWFVTVPSGTCLFTTGAMQLAGRIMMHEATTVAPLCYRQNVRPSFFHRPLCDLEPRRHLVSATVLDLWGNESLHMPVFSCRVIEVKKKVVVFTLLLPAKMNVFRNALALGVLLLNEELQ